MAKPSRIRRIARRARDYFPLTRLGVILGGLGTLAILHYGLKELDLVLLGAGIAGAGATLIGLLCTLFGLLVIGISLRRRKPLDTPISLECGYPSETGFSLPRLGWLPIVRFTWEWSAPRAQIRKLRGRGRAIEEVRPTSRGWADVIERRIVIGDVFGLTEIAFTNIERRPVRVMPSVGGLRQMHIVHSLSGGSDIPHPEGTPEGDRMDLRHYTPGDPIRFVLWSVFARTRELVVRTPERALSAARRTLAYLVAGSADEPAAGAARVAVDVGALGRDFAFGADGVEEPASNKDAAMEALARSGGAERDTAGLGLAGFIDQAAKGPIARTVVFVPGRPGPWLEGVTAAAARLPRDAAGRAPLEFVVCTDGVVPSRAIKVASKMAFRPEEREAGDERVDASELMQVVGALGRLGGKVLVVDRRDGHVHRAAG
ncbi:MAG: DUF58 domain-containing protein [Sandaracinaceae bacterium]|nr:DUF58 domain-containing protein [Sandaracinaceae bacterium]